MQDNSNQKIGVLEKIGYGLGDTASNVVFQMIMIFLPFFYTDIFGISAAAMGWLFLVVRVIDAVTDPIMGAITDRTETKWGKFRPYLLWLCVPYGVIAVLTFTTPDWAPGDKLIYAYITYTLLMIVYTAINIPYCALGGVITGDAEERVSLNSYRFFLATSAGVLIASTTLPLADWFGDGDRQKGFSMAMGVFSTLAVILFIVSFFLTKERVVQAADTVTDFWQDMKFLLRNDQWAVIAVLNFVLLIPLVIRGGAALYYLEWVVEREDLMSFFLTVGSLSAMVGAAFASPLTKRLSKVQAYSLLQGVIVLLSVGLYFVGKEQLILIFVVFALINFLGQMGSPILWAMMADTVDYGEYKTNRRTTGLVFSGAIFTLKMGVALGGAMLGWLLAYYGYQGDATTQAPETIHGILLLFTIIPAVGHFLLLGIIPRYKLNKEYHGEIRAELDKRQAAANTAGISG